MAKVIVPSTPSPSTTRYKNLKGVDFSVDASQVKPNRSPDGLNMIPDASGNPEKRKGWQKLFTTPSKVDNLWSCVIDGTRYFLCTYSTTLQEYTDSGLVGSGYTMTNAGKKVGFYSQTPTETAFYVFDTDKIIKCVPVAGVLTFLEVTYYTPLIIIARHPSTGGGSLYENINKMTRQRSERFLNVAGNNVAKSFLCTAIVDQSKPYSAKYVDANGVWQDATISSVSGATVVLANDYQPIGSEDNIEITYYATGANTASQVCGCTKFARFNPETIDQIFVTANTDVDYGQYVFYSDSGDPTYFPDQNYIYIGGSGTMIKGFLNVGENLAVIKSENAQEASVFFLYQTTIEVPNPQGTTDNLKVFASRQTAAGVGAIGDAMGVLVDEPLFLSPTGIYGIVPANYTSEKVVKNRSGFINPRLATETNLDEAVGTIWKDYFMVFAGSRVYILDGKQRAKDNDTGTYWYESYYWENVPASCVMSYEEEIYFSGVVGSDNAVCKFYTSASGTSYYDDTTAITARWSTPYDEDNGSQFYKTMQKKGSKCTIKPYGRSSVSIYIAADGQAREFVKTEVANSFSFSAPLSLDTGFSLETSLYPRDVFFSKKEKKYKRLQIILENAVAGEGFGVIEIIKTWYSTRYAK